MPWFDRHLHEDDLDDALHMLDRAVARARLAEALDAASGPYGLRRYGVRFEVRTGKARIIGLDTAPLPRGGGPPAPDAFDRGARTVEAAIDALRKALPAPWTFERGVAAYLRNADGTRALALRFDEDADAFRLDELRQPRGEPHPLEDPAYARALAAWDTRIAPLRARWTVANGDWSVSAGHLSLDGRKMRAVPLATHVDGRFTWLVEQPVADEAPFIEPELGAPFSDAAALALFAAARLGCVGVFQGALEDGGVLFAGLRD